MAILRRNEWKQMNEQQIISKLEDLYKELLKINAQRATHTPPENPGRVKEVKRTIARLYTLQHQNKSQQKKGIKAEKIVKKERTKVKEEVKKKHE